MGTTAHLVKMLTLHAAYLHDQVLLLIAASQSASHAQSKQSKKSTSIDMVVL